MLYYVVLYRCQVSLQWKPSVKTSVKFVFTGTIRKHFQHDINKFGIISNRFEVRRKKISIQITKTCKGCNKSSYNRDNCIKLGSYKTVNHENRTIWQYCKKLPFASNWSQKKFLGMRLLFFVLNSFLTCGLVARKSVLYTQQRTPD